MRRFARLPISATRKPVAALETPGADDLHLVELLRQFAGEGRKRRCQSHDAQRGIVQHRLAGGLDHAQLLDGAVAVDGHQHAQAAVDLLAAGLIALGLSGCGSPGSGTAGKGSGELLLVSYAVTKAAYDRIIPLFVADWKKKTGQTVTIRITVTKPNSLGGELLADTKPQTSERDAA